MQQRSALNIGEAESSASGEELDSAQQGEDDAHSLDANIRGSIVLIVDDELQNRRILSRQLAGQGFVVREAESARDALSLLRSEPVDAVLMDVAMPGMDGIEATRLIKVDTALREIPVIVFTGFSDTETRLRALQAGAEDFLGRPVDPLEMLVRLRNLLRLRGVTRVLRQQNEQLARLLRVQVSERHETEEELRKTAAKLEDSRQQMMQAQKMESIGRLAGGVAHDFNNLLTSIICFTRFVVDDMAESDPRRQDLVEVLKAADSAARLTGQLLAFSRRRPVQPVVLDLGSALASVDRVLRRTLGESVELVIIPAEEPLCALIDAGHFDQLIINLAVNARDAMPSGGTVTLRARARTLVDADAPAAGDFVELVVNDTGSGIKPDVAPHIFEPFFTTKGDKGTGLGLSTCYGIVQQAGGLISVQSELGKGATFSVLLPRVGESKAPDARRSSTHADLGLNGTVLVVEDQPAILRTMVRALRSSGLTVLEALNAEDALSVLSQADHSLDLLVTDVVLPGMSGPHLVERLRKAQPSLRVVYVSGYAGEDPDLYVHADDTTGFVPKPFTGRQLILRAAALLAGRAKAAEAEASPAR